MTTKLFGFSFPRIETNLRTPIQKDDDASIKIDSAPGFISPHVNAMSMDSIAATENDFITRYREASLIPEVSQCVEEIVSEAIVTDADDLYVTLDLDRVEMSESIKKKITDEFENVYNLLMFSRKGHDIFRRWYIDGRLNYQVVIDQDKPKKGIQALRFIDPRKIKRVRESIREIDQETGTTVITGYKEYYIYNEQGVGSSLQQNGTQNNATTPTGMVGINQTASTMTNESIVYVPSGILEPNQGFTISYLHQALRVANNLRMMEDSMLIYRLVRAPERRVFYIDTGNLPKAKASQYVQEIADKNKTKIVYDIGTGEIRNDRRYMAMTEDYWIPRKEGSRGTEIETLPGGEQIGETGEPEYYKNKLYTALNVPKSRFADQPQMFSTATQITRDEIRFSRFINQLRTKFSGLFEQLLARQLVLKGVMTQEEFDDIKVQISYEYAEDAYFAEAVKAEKLQSKASTLNAFAQYVGVYVSREYVYKEILGFTDEEMKHEIEQIDKEPPPAWAQPQEGDGEDSDPNLSIPDRPVTATESFDDFSSLMPNENQLNLLESLTEVKDSEIELNKALTDYLNKN